MLKKGPSDYFKPGEEGENEEEKDQVEAQSIMHRLTISLLVLAF